MTKSIHHAVDIMNVKKSLLPCVGTIFVGYCVVPRKQISLNYIFLVFSFDCSC